MPIPKSTSLAAPAELLAGPRGHGSRILRARNALQRTYGRGISAFFRGLEWLPPLSGQRQRLFESIEYSSTDVVLSGLGPGLEQLRIAFVSDVHAGFYFERGEIDRMTERLRDLAPDVICLGGDLVANHFNELEHYTSLLELDPPMGMFAVPGNHEHFYFVEGGESMQDYAALLESHGIRMLLNRGTRLERDGASLWLCGIDDLDDGKPNLGRALQGRQEGEPSVLLSHHPDTFLDSAERGVDLQLSGHTHGGQLRFMGWSPITHSNHGFRDGLFTRGASQLYVGRGVGCSLMPLRIGVRPEVPMFRLLS